jgi:hypothetical protein
MKADFPPALSPGLGLRRDSSYPSHFPILAPALQARNTRKYLQAQASSAKINHLSDPADSIFPDLKKGNLCLLSQNSIDQLF